MSESLSAFTDRLYAEWLPAFCNAPSRRKGNYSIEGFQRASINSLSEFDAKWFMMAVDAGCVTHESGFFRGPRSNANEQLFWSGQKGIVPRPLTLWIEPIITMGGLARLSKEFSWPIERLGMQSEKWAFDLVAYDTSSHEILVGEVKKSDSEVGMLIDLMSAYSKQNPLPSEPVSGIEKNAYRKVQHISRTWPNILWALGPRGEGHVFRVARKGSSPQFDLLRRNISELSYGRQLASEPQFGHGANLWGRQS